MLRTGAGYRRSGNASWTLRGSRLSARRERLPTWRAATCRNPCGERLVAAVPQGHWQTTTFIAGAAILYLNPIEQLFAKLKTLLRNPAARTKDASGKQSAASSRWCC
jgi:hypothetical protein